MDKIHASIKSSRNLKKSVSEHVEKNCIRKNF